MLWWQVDYGFTNMRKGCGYTTGFQLWIHSLKGHVIGLRNSRGPQANEPFTTTRFLFTYHTPTSTMATIYFPQKAPTESHANRLILKRHKIHERDKCPTQISVDTSMVASVPPHYVDHIKRFVWREDCIRLVLHLNDEIEIPQLEKNLKMILWYMDEVFRRFVVELPQRLDENDATRSNTFDNYLRVEYWVGRHEAVNVRDYRRSNDRNINRTNVEELGMSSSRAPIYLP